MINMSVRTWTGRRCSSHASRWCSWADSTSCSIRGGYLNTSICMSRCSIHALGWDITRDLSSSTSLYMDSWLQTSPIPATSHTRHFHPMAFLLPSETKLYIQHSYLPRPISQWNNLLAEAPPLIPSRLVCVP